MAAEGTKAYVPDDAVVWRPATVLSVADRRPVELTSTWQGNQKVVVEFLRHFG